MPKTKEKKTKVSQKAKKEIKESLKGFRYAEIMKFLQKSSDLINDVIADWCIKIVYGEREQDTDLESETHLYWLANAGAEIFSTYRKKIPHNSELLKITQQLAALCFPYTPSLNFNFYFILEKNYLAPHNQIGHLNSYFFFLRYLLVEKNIDFTVRLSCLSGALQFYTAHKKYLTNAFVEKLFFLLNSSEAKDFFLEYKQASKDYISTGTYIPHYQFLMEQSKEFWEEFFDFDIEAWEIRLMEKITEANKADNAFIRAHNLTIFSLFEREFDKFIQVLLLSENDAKAKDLKAEIFLPTRAITEQIAIFTRQDNPLREFFSADLLDLLRKKNQLKPQQVLAECEAEENRRIKFEEEEKAARQLKEEIQKNQQKEQNEKRLKEEATRKIKEKTEQEVSYLKSYITEVYSSLERATSYVKQRIQVFETKNTDPGSLSQKFNSELGKIYSKLESICDLLHLEKQVFSRNQKKKYISDFLLEVKNKIKEQIHFPEEEVNVLMEKIIKIEMYIEKEVKAYGSEIIKKLEALQVLEEKLRGEIITNVEFLENNSELSSKEMKKINKCRTKIEKLFSQFNQFAMAYREYAQLIPMDQEFKKYGEIQENLDSLVKIFSVLAKELEANAKAKQLATKAQSLTRTSQSPADFLSNYQKHIDWEKDFKTRFYQTLSVIHRLPYIKDEHGGKAFIAIFLRKLGVYKQEIAQARSDLLGWEGELTKRNRRAWHCRVQGEKTELAYLEAMIMVTVYQAHDKSSEFNFRDIAQIDFMGMAAKVFSNISKDRYSLEDILIIYLKGKKEFTEMCLERQELFKKCVSSFETFLPTLQACEDAFIASKALCDTFFSKKTTHKLLEAEYLQRKELLEEKRVELDKCNKGFLKIFTNYQLHQSESAIFSTQPAPIVLAPPIAVVTVPSIVQVPLVLPIYPNSYGAFFSPSMGNQVGSNFLTRPEEEIPQKFVKK